MSLELELARKLGTVWPVTPDKPKPVIKLSPEETERRRQRLKKFWQDPEFRQKRLEGVKRAHERISENPRLAARRLDSVRKAQASIKRAVRNRLANYKRWSDPEQVRIASERCKKLWEDGTLKGGKGRLTKEGIARKIEATKAMHDKRRGFKIPDRLRAEYDRLVNSKKIKAREAGRMLGLI